MAFACSQKHGIDEVYPALATISNGAEFAIGKRGASDGWDYINASLLIAGTCAILTALLTWLLCQAPGN